MDPLAEARFDVSDDDLIALHTRFMRKSPLFDETRRRNWRVGIQAGILVAAVFAAAAYFTAPTPAQGLTRAGFWILAYSIIWPLYAVRNLTRAAFDRRVQKTAARFVRERKVPYTLGPCQVLLFSDQVMVVENEGSFAKPWTTIRGVEEQSDATFLDFTDGNMLRIPNRAFASDEARQEFLRAARSHLNT